MAAFEAVRRGQMDVSEVKSLCSRTKVKDNESLVEVNLLLNKISIQTLIIKEGRQWASLGHDVFMANGVFKRCVLKLHVSYLDKILYRHTLSDEERCC